MGNIFNNLSVFEKSMLGVLAVLFIVLLILIIYLCVKTKQDKETSNLDFLDDIKEKTKSVEEKIESIENISSCEPVIEHSLSKQEENKIENVEQIKTSEQSVEESKFDITEATKMIEEDIEKNNIELTEFELEQEEKSIISYQELISKVQEQNVNKNVNIQTVDLDDEKNNTTEFSFNTEILDFSELKDENIKEPAFKVSPEISPIEGLKNPNNDLFKTENIQSILNIEEIDKTLYSNDQFLNALKELRDSLE